MSQFRKMLFAAAAVASFLGTGSTANAQNPFVCNTSFSPLVVRVEGLRELVGDIVITCTGGTSIGSDTNRATNGGTPPVIVGNPGGVVSSTSATSSVVPAINIQVTVPGAVIANQLIGSSNLTDALLFIDEPTNPSAGTSRLNQNPCTLTAASGQPGVCQGLSYYYENGIATGAGYAPTTSGGPSSPLNVFQGQYGSGGGFFENTSTITFVGVPVVQPGSFPNAGSRIYRIKNVRVRIASSFPSNTQVQAYVAIQNPPANLLLNNSAGVIGFVQTGLRFNATLGGPYAQCLGFNAPNGAIPASSTGTSILNTGGITFTEAYGVAFKRRGFGGPLDVNETTFNQFYLNGFGQANPTVNYNNESGFYNLTYGATNNLNTAGIATNGTRLRARFTSVPANVRIYVSAAPIGSGTFGTNVIQGPLAPGAAYAVGGADANGAVTSFTPNTSYAFTSSSFTSPVQGSAALGFAPLTSPGGIAYTGPGTMVSNAVRYIPVTIAADGTGVFFWEVLRADDNTIDSFTFLVATAFVPTTTIVTDTNVAAIAFVSGSFAPVANPAVLPSTYSSIPAFVLPSAEGTSEIFRITNCATNLLYPFVSSVTGFNTGVAVANTSSDPFGTINESGICRVFFYGTSSGGGVPPANQAFTKPVPSGQVAAFNLLFGGPDWGITPVVGFQGYIIISCNFRWAHGFAFISDPSNLQTAHGYLALILDPMSPTLRRNTGASSAEQLDN